MSLAPSAFAPVEEAIEDIRAGKLVVVVDAADRENAGDRLGGHVVQGHVDGVGRIGSVSEDGFARRVEVEAPEEVLRYVIEKGSIAVDGVSLTVAAVFSGSFTVSLIPETLQRTNLGQVEPGTRVNLEVDVLAKYVEKLIGGRA